MHLPRLAALAVLTAVPLAAQNALQHHDGNAFATRGANGGAARVLLQRLPQDQACGRSNVANLSVVIQDQQASTAETFTIEIRGNDPLVPGTPDMSPAGLLGAVGPIPIQFPGAGSSAVTVNVPLGIATPPFASGVNADLYIAIVLPAAPAWPADGLSIQANGGAPMNPLAIGYTGVAGVAGLGWESPAGGPPLLSPGNKTFDLRSRFVDDTLLPFAIVPSPFPQPSFGYVALFPDLASGHQIGWRTLATGSLGDVAALVIGTPLGSAVPAPLPVNSGLLCLNATLPLLNLGIAVYGPGPSGEPAGTVAASWGPYTVSPIWTGTVLNAQAVSLKSSGQIALSTSCRTQL